MTDLQKAIEDLEKAPRVNIKGKQYATVATRVECFRRYFPPPEWAIETDAFGLDNEWVRVKASILHNGVVVATGMGEENRSQGPINRTSALENCETSAVGRALSAFGLHGGEYASANEVQEAIAKQEADKGAFVKTSLKAQSHEIVRELHACTDMDMLKAYWESKEVSEPLKRMKTHYKEGYDACNEEKEKMKEQLMDVAERHALENENILAAG